MLFVASDSCVNKICLRKNKSSIWCDTGKAFRCAQTNGYLFKELAVNKIHGNNNFI